MHRRAEAGHARSLEPRRPRMVGYMEKDEQHSQSPDAGTSAATETGRLDRGRAQDRFVQGDPPLASDRPGVVALETPQDPNSADWRYLYSLVRDRYRDEKMRGDTLDQKTGVLLAGAIAAIAFTYANGPTGWWSLVLLVFLLPLWHMFQAFRTRLGKSAPNPETLADRFPYYPQTMLRVAIGDMVKAREIDANLNDEKDDRLDWAMSTLAGAFVIVLLVQIGWRVTESPALTGMRTSPSIPHTHAH